MGNSSTVSEGESASLQAKVVERMISIDDSGVALNGTGIISIQCDGPPEDVYSQFKSAPAVLEFAGRHYGKSCFDSGRFRIYYRTDAINRTAAVVDRPSS
jgi:hypothetical protein